jgi:receptor expression-enhancing protein 5/6
MILGALTSSILITCMGVVWPAYASFKALQKMGESEADVQWLTYWIIFGLFYTLEFLPDLLISWVPLYYEAKVAFVLWLQLPYFNGASQLYGGKVQPFLETYEEKIDATVTTSLEKVKNIKADDLKVAYQFAADKIAALKDGKPKVDAKQL